MFRGKVPVFKETDLKIYEKDLEYYRFKESKRMSLKM
jgi:hypothetical protein